MNCSKCGFNNPEGMRFCGQCAAPLQQTCPACGCDNPPDFSYCGHCASRLDGTAAGPAQRTKDAERRQLTVLFCDIIGSSTLSENLDPEELRDIIYQYRSVCSEIISGYGGHIAQYLGDGILVYFGYPMAHEDDAQRAVHSALDIVRRVPRITYTQHGDSHALAVRIGIHTGMVVIGDMGNGDKRNLALGETPNIAARLQDRADRNGIVISEASKRLLDDSVHCTSLGRHQLKGFSQPIELYQIDALTADSRAGRPAPAPARAPLIGREQETTLLLERLQLARKGIGQLILLSGEPGMGKTRLVDLVTEQLIGDDCITLQCAGTAYFQNSFLYPVIDMLRREFKLHTPQSDADKLRQLEKTVATLSLDSTSVVPVLAELLSIPLDDGYTPAGESTPQQKKQRTLDTLLLMLHSMAQQRLVLLIVEDLQWVDASTLELLTQFASQPGMSNILALFTFRQEFSNSWPHRTHLTHISLNRLTRSQAGHMIRGLCRQKTLPAAVFEEIINKTDGIPFFIEELTTALLDSNLLLEKSDHFELTMPIAQLGIPSTLQDLLMSRLDSLGEEKELAQISAILGREFDHEVLRAVSSRDEKSFSQGLDHLLNAELFLQHGQRPKAWYQFRHALLREAAYQSLLKRTRQKYHQRIATLLQGHFPQMARENPELLAHHFTEAGEHRQALAYWLKAGQLAISHSANIEAIAHLKQGLALVGQLPESAEKVLLELALQTSLGQAYMVTKGYAAPEVEAAYARARELSHDIGDVMAIFPVLCGLWEYAVVRADFDSACSLAGEIDQLAQKSGQPHLLLEAQRAIGTTQLWRGNLQQALEFLKPGIVDVDSADITRPARLMPNSQDARVATLANISCVQWLSGQSDQALDSAQQALRLARRLGHPFSQAYALNFLSTLTQLRGEAEAVAEHAEVQIVLCATYGFPFWGAMGKMLLAWAQAGHGPHARGIEDFRLALLDYERCGSRIARSYFLALFARLQQQAGDLDGAAATLDGALKETLDTGEAFFKAELLRLKGEILLEQKPAAVDAAETVLSQALQLAQTQGAHMLALRAATSLARLLLRQQRTGEADALLQAQLGRIEGGATTADVTAAQALRQRAAAGHPQR